MCNDMNACCHDNNKHVYVPSNLCSILKYAFNKMFMIIA